RKHKTSGLSRQTPKAERAHGGPLSGNVQLEERLPKQDLGASLFGATPSSDHPVANLNPFSTSNSAAAQINPFAPLPPPSAVAVKSPQKPSPLQKESLPESFAEKVRLSSPPTSRPSIFA